MILPINQVLIGDCGDVMAEWPGNSVDCVITDPPYRIGFMGKSWDKALPPRRAFRQIYRVLKPGALAFIMSSPRQDVLWRMLSMLEEIGFELRQSFISWIYKTGFPKAYDVSKGIDRKLGLERDKKLIQTKRGNTLKFDSISYAEEGFSGFRDVSAPVSNLAKKWEGWKSQTGLKPALECILMVNKPRSEPTIVDNVLRWGTGAVNVDACRIPFKNEADFKSGHHNKKLSEPNQEQRIFGASSGYGLLDSDIKKGRFPANLLISDGALDTGETTKSRAGIRRNRNTESILKKGFEGTPKDIYSPVEDEGSPYRFFDLDAWAEHHGFLDVAKPSKTERDFGLTNFSEIEQDIGNLGINKPQGRSSRGRVPKQKKHRNIHPTCKPVKLMAYLIELGCPPKGIVLDPFLGSGTTCISAKRLRRNWIGIEINPEYAEIAEARINIRGPLDQYMEREVDENES